MHDEKKNGHFSDGFFLGALIGGGLAVLLTHKKGREFLRELFDEGLEFIEEKVGTRVENAVFEEEIPESEIVEEKLLASESAVEEKEEKQSAPSTSKKRFFKGPKKST